LAFGPAVYEMLIYRTLILQWNCCGFLQLLQHHICYYINGSNSVHTRRHSRVWTHAVLLLNLNLTLTFQPQNHTTSRISLGWFVLQLCCGHWCGKYSYWPCDLWTPKTILLLGFPKVIPLPSLNTLGSFVFELCSGQIDKQTDKRTKTWVISVLCKFVCSVIK